MISWVPYDLENARASMMRWSTLEQRGLWSCGFMQGATGAILMGGEPEAFLDGYAAGSAARENSDEYRKEQVADKRKAAARKRWDANGHANGMQKRCKRPCKSDAKRCYKTRQYKTRQRQQFLLLRFRKLRARARSRRGWDGFADGFRSRSSPQS